MKDRQNQGYIQVLLAGALWGLVGLFTMRLDAMGIDSMDAGLMRVGFAFLICFVLTVASKGLSSFRISMKGLLGCLLVGIGYHALYNIFYLAAVVRIGVSTGAILLRIAPVFTAIASVLLLKEHFSKGKGAALLINIVGCIMVVAGGAMEAGHLSVLGLLFGLGAGSSYGFLAIMVRIIPEDVDPLVISTYGYFFATIVYIAICRPWENPDVFTEPVLFNGFLLGLIPTALAYVFYYAGTQKIKESSKVPVIASSEAVVAALTGFILFREPLGIINLAGIIIVLASIVFMSRAEAEPKA